MAKLKVGQSGETENGVRYRLLADGPGSEVVGLSGIGARGDDPDVWGELTDALERRFIGVDLRAAMGRMATRRRGAASSMYPASFFEYEQLAKDGFGEMAELGVLPRPNPDAVAVSWSAALATHMKKTRPDALGRVVAISAPPEGPSLPAAATQIAMITQAVRRMMGDGSLTKEQAQRLFGGSEDDIQEVIDKFDVFKHPSAEDIRDDTLQQIAIQQDAASPSSVMASAWRFWGSPARDIEDVMFLNGEFDRISPPTERSLLIRRGGHLIHLTHAEEVADYANWHFVIGTERTENDTGREPLVA